MKPSVLSKIAAQRGNAAKVAQWVETRSAQATVQAEYVAPSDATEEAVATIWAKLLRLERVSRNDDFFACGGQSLLATQMLARVRDRFSIELPLRSIFESPTLQDFAAAISSAGTSAPTRRIARAPRGNTAPLSLAQQRLWFVDQLGPGNAAYNVPQRLHLSGNLDVPALQLALDQLVERHETLRTGIITDGQPHQVITDNLRLPLVLHDLRGLNPAERDGAAALLGAQEAATPFDLSQAPLMRASLIQLATHDYHLVLVLHHIISDRWSFNVLAQDLSALYAANLNAAAIELPPLEIQYADFASWQRQYLEEDVLKQQLEYWKERLEGAPALLELPLDHPRPAVETFLGASHIAALPSELAERLTEICREEDATLFMGLMAAFKVLLARHSGQSDLVVGTPIANRSLTELEPLIGFFVNTLAMRTDLSGDPDFREVVRRVKETALGAYAHEQVPFERIVEELKPERSLSHNPIFQVMFTIQEAQMSVMDLPGVEVSSAPLWNETATTDMSWFANVGAEGLRVRVEYARDLFDPVTVDRMIRRFQQLLEAIIADPATRISELPIVLPEERKLLTEWNDTAADVAYDRCAHDLFQEQVERTPDNLAVKYRDQQLSYRELNERANQLAHRLQKLGVGPEVPVAVCVGPSVELVIGIIAVTKAGGSFIPIDPANPTERIGFMLDDACVPVLLTQTSLLSKLPPHSGITILLDSAQAELAHESADNLISGATPESRAYMIYTSGSTGRPKGVEVLHRNLVNLIAWHHREYNPQPRHRAAQMVGFSFDPTVYEMWPYLTVGASLHIADSETRVSPELALVWLKREAITHCVLITPLAEAVLQLLKDVGTDGLALETVIVGGDKLRLRPQPGLPFAFVNHYGPTENTVVTTIDRVASEGEGAPHIGKPISNVRVYVLDANRRLAPIGVAGELCTAGANVARGYWKRPDLTADRFNSIPDGDCAGERLYLAGDRVRWRNDGNLEFLGRFDDQVKIRGFRIEPGEIEAVLVTDPSIKECAVLVHGKDRNERLIAYVVPAHPPIVEGQLREFLRAQLPDYMVPSVFVTLDAFPLTPNGKIDRKALPIPEISPRQWVAPRSDAEELVASIWGELLQRGAVGADEDFFALGGHSLLATQVISRVRQLCQVELPLRSIFEAPTVAEFALRLQQARREIGGVPPPPIVPVPRDGDLELSFAQQRLWFIYQLERGNPLYNVTQPIRMRGNLNRAALVEALNELLRRHEALRTTFVEIGDGPVQKISAELTFPLNDVDLSGTPSEQCDEVLRQLAIKEGQLPFDLQNGPLVRGTLVGLSADEHVLLLNSHHIVNDGWSVVQILRQLGEFYSAAVENKSTTLLAPKIQYADYAVWQRGYMQGEVLEKHLAWWTERLRGVQVLEIPTDRPRPAVQSFRGAIEVRVLSCELRDSLKALSARHGASLYMTLLAAFQALLHRYTGQQDITIGSPIANRNYAEIEDLIGFFLNALVMRADFSGEPTFLELLHRTRDYAFGAYAHQDLPFEMLVEAMAPDRDLSRNPLFQVWFVMQNTPRSNFEFSGLELSGMGLHNGTCKSDLGMIVADIPDGLKCTVEYATDLFDAGTMQRLLGSFEVLLEAIVADAAQKVSELPLMGRRELWEWREGWNQTACLERGKNTVAGLVSHAARTHASAVAIDAADGRLTYTELEAQSNRLAHLFAARGFRPGSLAGVALARSSRMMVVLLAIRKLGAAYLPLDTSHPADRLTFIAQDAGIEWLITERAVAAQAPRVSSTLLLEDLWQQLQSATEEFPGPEDDPERPAYVRYTSGSSGKPKGVVVPERAIVNFLRSMQQRPGIVHDDCLLAVTTLSFDISELELWLPLIVGGRLALATREDAIDPARLSALLVRSGATVMQATPATWSMLVTSGWQGSRNLKALCGGEALPPELAGHLLTRSAELWNLYGPTETTVWSSIARVDAPSAIRLGDPIANTQLYVCDAHLRPVPVGAIGELLIAGEGLATGYLHRPELTAEKFVQLASAGGAKAYRTGDLVRRRADGTLDYVGRGDEQVKLRGFRIELGEIEAVLSRCAGVEACVVMLREDTPGHKRLVAYVVVKPGEQGSESEWWADLKAGLPEYMLPAAFVRVERLPLSPNGKIDRKQLPPPDQGEFRSAEHVQALRTPTEELLANIWSGVLHVNDIGPDSHFFQMGGHSLTATQLVSRVRQAFRVELPLRAVFASPVLSSMATSIDQLARGESNIPPPIIGVPRDRPLPLSLAQQRLWFFDQLDPNTALFNFPHVIRLTGRLDVDALQYALNQVIVRHEVLRTSYEIALDDEPVQVIAPELTIDLPLIVTTSEAEAQRLVNEEVARPFDLARGPVLRATLVQLAENDHVFVLCLHHIATDGWSAAVLFNELFAGYEAAISGTIAELPELSIQYADYSVWQRAWLRGEVLDRQLAYWKQALTGAPPLLALPTDKPRPAVQTHDGAVLRASIPTPLMVDVATLARESGLTPFMVTLAAFQVMVFLQTKNPDVVLGTDIANRTSIETERLIGFFVNLVALRTDLSGDPSFHELLERVRDVALAGYAHQDLPFDKLVDELQPDRNLSYNPLVQVLFVYQNTPRSTASLSELKRSSFPVAGRSKFDMAVFTWDSEDGLTHNWVYNSNLFEPATIARMAQLFHCALEHAVRDPQIKLSELLDRLHEADRERRSAEETKLRESSVSRLRRADRRNL